MPVEGRTVCVIMDCRVRVLCGGEDPEVVLIRSPGLLESRGVTYILVPATHEPFALQDNGKDLPPPRLSGGFWVLWGPEDEVGSGSSFETPGGPPPFFLFPPLLHNYHRTLKYLVHPAL